MAVAADVTRRKCIDRPRILRGLGIIVRHRRSLTKNNRGDNFPTRYIHNLSGRLSPRGTERRRTLARPKNNLASRLHLQM